jgi:NCS2 family nucleobase:cation symporter-2
MGGMLIALSCLPWPADVLAIMPRPVIGAILTFTGCVVVINGLQIMASRLFDARRTFVVGFAAMIAPALYAHPIPAEDLPTWLEPFVLSPTIAAIVTALVLNAVFRLGVRTSAEFVLDPAADPYADTVRFVERAGGTWGARKDVIARVSRSLGEFAEIAPMVVTGGTKADVSLSFDEAKIIAQIRYAGRPLSLEQPLMTPEDVLEADEDVIQIVAAGAIIGGSADRRTITQDQASVDIWLEFEH